jgi:hypothetical protein
MHERRQRFGFFDELRHKRCGGQLRARLRPGLRLFVTCDLLSELLHQRFGTHFDQLFQVRVSGEVRPTDIRNRVTAQRRRDERTAHTHQKATDGEKGEKWVVRESVGLRDLTRRSRSISMPVRMPIPLSIYTTSSVATLPVAPLAYGQPPTPPTAESITEMPCCSAIKMLDSAWPYYSHHTSHHITPHKRQRSEQCSGPCLMH